MSEPALPIVPGASIPDTVAGMYLLDNYAQTQQAVANQAASTVDNLWQSYIVPASFNDSWNAIAPLVNQIVSAHYGASAVSASAYYSHSRIVAGFKPRTVRPAQPDADYISAVTDIMGPGKFFQYLGNGADDSAASEMARNGFQGAATRVVMKGGRDTVTDAATRDSVAEGWERIIEPGACGFCAMLAGRGGVYRESTADFQAHDHCHCVAAPVFSGQTPVNAALSAAWGKATIGKHGKEAVAAWNSHWQKITSPEIDGSRSAARR
jgi:hypothetical protein